MMHLARTESSRQAKTTAWGAPSGVPKVHAGQCSRAKRWWCGTRGALSRPTTRPPRGGRPGCCCWLSVDSAALAPPARWTRSVWMRQAREIGDSVPSTSSSTAATAALRARPRRAGRATSACSTSPRATRLSPEPHLGCVRKLSMRTSQLRPEKRGLQARNFAQLRDERTFWRLSRGRKYP